MKKTNLLLVLTLVVVLFAPQAEAKSIQADGLTGQTWQWVSFTDPLEAYQVESPESYLLTFNEDTGAALGAGGTVAIVADCNNASGSYTARDGSLAIDIGPMTMAACAPDSRSDQFVGLLGSAARYFFENGFLYIDLLADGGTMAFAVPGEPESAGDVTSYPWLWTSFTSPVEQFEVEAPENYVVIFNEDTGAALGAGGTVNIKADCNNASGSYTVDGSSLTIEVGPMTMAACAPDSRSDQFVELLGYAAIYFFEDAQLYIDLFADGGTMVFAPEGEAELAEAAAQSTTGSSLPPAELANDEGGPAVVTGEWNYTAAAVATHYLEPVAVLLDVSHQIQGNYTEWVPRSGQIMGTLTSPLAPAPTAYEVDVPVQPGGASADVDNDGEEDAGIQIYAAVLGTNLVGDSYLEQVEQEGFTSYLGDPQTGAIREGTFLVYASDDAQGFPGSAGEDGVFFTADDPAVGLPAGWTLVTLSEDGQVSFDRSRAVTMNILEAAAYASPDFTDQGILESYNSLIDVLSERYSYTDLRGLDWEEIRQEYLARVEAADEADDFPAYYAAMNDLALSIKDAHVYVSTNVPQYKSAAFEQYDEDFGARLGAQVVELEDGRFALIYLDPEGPGAEAGWQFGTEIVSVDGVPIGERIETLPPTSSAGNPEAIRLDQTQRALAFPVGSETTIEYRQPGESELRSVTLTAVEGAFAIAPGPSVEDADISFKELEGGAYYVQWKQFRDPLYKVAVWEKFLSQAQGAPGIIIDMRHNGGGATDLLYTIASYLFTAEDPAQLHWVDEYTYDEKAGGLVQEFATDYKLSSPRPELTFNGAVVVLVGKDSASAAEYLPQFLQRQGRAIVVGEHGTEGAGGYLEYVAMPGDFTFHFTKGRTFFAGTDELNLEAKGVDLDVRVPITLENEQAKQGGRDVVLEAALVALGEEAARRASEQLPGTTWQLMELLEVATSTGTASDSRIENPENYTVTFEEDGAMSIQADCNQAQAEYALGAGGTLTITLGATTLAECPEGSLSEEFLQGLGGSASFQTDGKLMVIMAETEDGQVIMQFQIVEWAPSSSEAGELPEELVAQLGAFLESQVCSEGGYPEGAAPGLVLLVDTPEGRYLNAAGVRSIEDGTPMQEDDRLEIGSNSKSFLIAVLMQLQEEGVLSFDDLLSDWLPEQAEQIPNGEQITLRQMAQHTAGIWDYGDPMIGEAATNPDKLEQGYTPEELVQYAVENGTPDFAPGENWKYSNTGYILLGMIAEKATGQSLGDLFQERIFDPLGLETAVLIEGVPAEGEITTQGYWWLDDGTRLNTTNWNVSQGWAAGGLAMNAEELASYGKALAAGDLFQAAESLEQMLAFDERALLGGAAYGLGLQDYGNGYWGHEGQTAGFQSLWFTNPDEQVTVVGLTNSAAYKAYLFLNVIHILEGRGLQPFDAVTLLPIADQSPGFFTSKWAWVQARQGSVVADIPPGIILAFAKDGTATVSSLDCGEATGTFTADAQSQIAFDLDRSAVTCTGREPLVQFLDVLDAAGSTWRYENGGLVITLADGDGELVFGPPQETVESIRTEACPLFDLPFPRPEPAYTGKLARDLTPFASALEAYTADQAAAREALVSGKTIPELQALMEDGELTAVDLVVYYLDRIQRYDVDRLNSVLELNPEALEIAQGLDEERAAGDVRGPMHGIPVLLKDNIATGDDMHTAAGAAAMLAWDPDRDAFLVSQLRDAGAVILGKANLSEWANYMDSCMPNGFSTNGGQTQNPYGPYETYGSSSGSAVSVAADLTTISVGTETQGSIISPAVVNSVVALKTSRGLVSRDYVIPLLPWQDVPGPMGRTVADIAVLLSAMTGVDENDPETAKAAELAGTDFTQFLSADGLDGVRVGVPIWNDAAFEQFFEENNIIDSEQQASLRDTFGAGNEEALQQIDALSAAGVTAVEVPAPAIPSSYGLGLDVQAALEYGFKEALNEFLAGLGDGAPLRSLEEIIAFNNEDLANRAPYGQDLLEGSQNTAISADAYAAMEQGNQATARDALEQLFDQYGIDIVLSEVGQVYAPAGYPALTVPSGYAEDGTPRGVVFIGGYLSEPQLLAVAYAYEQATQARVPPDLEATMELIEEIGSQTEKGEEQEMATDADTAKDKPAYVTDLEAAYGAPSQTGFGSAVFFTALDPDNDLEQVALAYYQYFVGDLWERYGEDAWMGPWKEVYARAADTSVDTVTELKGITDADARASVSMILEVVENAEAARQALSAAYDDPAVTELGVYNLGDGGTMSGLLVAGRRDNGEATFLVFLMD